LAFKMAEKRKTLAPSQAESVARALRADRRTVQKVAEGKPVRGQVGLAIDEELKRRGWR
jgi:hypothetical protein